MLIGVLEDDASIREVVSLFFESLGHSVRAFSEALAFVDAVTLASPGAYDALICDQMLPGQMSGAAAICAIRLMYPSIPAVILSGTSPSEFAKIALDLPDVPCLRKPFPMAQLIQQVELLTLKYPLKKEPPIPWLEPLMRV